MDTVAMDMAISFQKETPKNRRTEAIITTQGKFQA